jgi:hypothetical protein
MNGSEKARVFGPLFCRFLVRAPNHLFRWRRNIRRRVGRQDRIAAKHFGHEQQ